MAQRHKPREAAGDLEEPSASDAEVSTAWADERRRLLDELARRVKEANGLRADLAAASSETSHLRSEAQRCGDMYTAQAVDLQAQVEQAKAQLQRHEAEREAVLRRCAELQRRAVGVNVVTQDAERQREEIAAVTLECGEVRDRLSRVATLRLGSHGHEAGDAGQEDVESAAHYISDAAIRGTGDLFRVLVSLQERLATPPVRQQTAQESAVAEQTASRWELEYAYGRAERQREALQLELESERKAVRSLKQQLTQLASSDVRTGTGALGALEEKLAAALQKNTELMAAKDAAESKLRMLEHDDGGPTAGNQIRVLTRQLAQARSQIVAADERGEVAKQKCVAMEHELVQEKNRYDQLRLQVDHLVAATTNATAAVASPWHSPRRVSQPSAGYDTQHETPSRRQHQHQRQRLSNQAAGTVESLGKLSTVLPGSTTSYGIDEEVLELPAPPLPPGRERMQTPSLSVQDEMQRTDLNVAAVAPEGEPSTSLGLRQRLFTARSSHR